ncbi:MAG: hypothetical protein Q9163_006438 [Psora crenata]
MRVPRLSQNASTIIFILSLLFITRIAAQQAPPQRPGQGDDATTSDSTAPAVTATSTSDANSASAAPSETTSATSDDATSSDSSSDTARTTQAAASTSDQPSSTELPPMSTTSEAVGLTGLSRLPGDDYPPPTVPPTANAPYMQKSTLPEGTVFICVGAALGFFGCMVLAWRGLVAWSLHRSVKRAAMAQTVKYAHVRDPRGGPGKPQSQFASIPAGSNLSLDLLTASGKAGGGNTHSAHNSLFFSPTAGAGMHNPSIRGSGYLPAGYYAAGNAAPGGGGAAGMTTHSGAGAMMPISNLGTPNKPYSRSQSRGQSPPRSPSLPPSRGADSFLSTRRLSTQGLVGAPSSSSLNLSVPPQGRAPSAYLEDLFENQPPVQPVSEERRGSRRY